MTDLIWNNLRYACRALLRVPGFTAVSVLTLALGIGANTAVFSVVYSVLLRPLPYSDANEIVCLRWYNGHDFVDGFTAAEYEFSRRHAGSFQALAGFQGPADLEMQQPGDPAPSWVKALRITSGFFETLASTPSIGRAIGERETTPGAPQTAVLTDHLWRTAFDRNPEIIGKQIILNGESYTVIGVLPQDFTFSQPVDVFVPLKFDQSVANAGNNIDVLGRLKNHVRLRDAQAEMSVLVARWDAVGQSHHSAVQVVGYQDWLTRKYRLRLLVLIAASSFLLLIAFANVSSLFLARGISRQREISIRRALGATRKRILGQLLTEASIIGVAGALVGLSASTWGTTWLISAMPWNLPVFAKSYTGRDLFAFVLTMGVTAGAALGLAGFLQMSASGSDELLKAGRAGGHSHKQNRFVNMVVVVEIALSLMLVLGATVLIRTLFYLNEEKLGFDPTHVISMETPLPPGSSSPPSRTWALERQSLVRLQTVAGVQFAAVVSVLPLSGTNNLPAQRAGYPNDSTAATEYRAVSPDYFEAMKIPILRGRGFLDSDTESSAPVALVSDTLARMWWRGDNPLGDHVVVGEFQGKRIPQILEPTRVVVGVVGDVKGALLHEPSPPTIYVPAPQVGNGVAEMMDSVAWVVRAKTGYNAGLANSLRTAVAPFAAGRQVLDVQPIERLVANSVALPKFNGFIMGAFAGVALLLTVVGVYGVLNFEVRQRTHDIAIRIALGASPGRIMKNVLWHVGKLAIISIGIGFGGGFILTHLMVNMLYGMRPLDFETFMGVSGILLSVALLAAYVPSRRAMLVDPVTSLHVE